MIEKFIDLLLNIFDPPSRIEQRLERRWQCKLRKLKEQMNPEVFIGKEPNGKQETK